MKPEPFHQFDISDQQAEPFRLIHLFEAPPQGSPVGELLLLAFGAASFVWVLSRLFG